MDSNDFPALPGFYKLLFLYLEPISTISPSIMAWFAPGSVWFWHQLIPSSTSPPPSLDPRSTMAIWQLGNCYLLLGLISSLVFRAVRDNLKNNLAAQENILAASFTALALADVSHIALTLFALPDDIRYNVLAWNSMTHGNVSVVVVLLSVRIAWFLGIGRTSYTKAYVKHD